MKHLKSSYKDLREFFDRMVSVRYIAEPLASFDSQAACNEVLTFMKNHDYDVVGIRREGSVVGYVKQSGLKNRNISQHLIPFSTADLLDDSAPLISAFSRMRQSPQIFVRVFGQVGGIVTRGDFQKAPVRMWLFGLISLLEMQLLRLIREAYPEESWKQLIASKRLNFAERILTKRRKRNEAIDLADCLQFCDKRDIVLKSAQLRRGSGFASEKECEDILKELEEVRNNLAHAQDIIKGFWPQIINLTENAEALLRQCEETTCAPVGTRHG
ncbi:MAG TPA: hypothetical protein DCR97_13955 [Deltaproteobacteria bacterium]|nr:hypothetical protein [Deltaproteobacteria bacterium]